MQDNSGAVPLFSTPVYHTEDTGFRCSEKEFESIDRLLSLSDKKSVELIKNKIRSEMKKGLLKDKIINDEDKILFHKFYQKVKNEFQEIEK